MKAFCITLRDNDESIKGFTNLVDSSGRWNNPFNIELFNASTPFNYADTLKKECIKWNYPLFPAHSEVCPFTGLIKSPYTTKNNDVKIACAVSHFLLWKKCIELNEPILILEHDALFINTLGKQEIDDIVNSGKLCMGINNPQWATRRPLTFDSCIRRDNREIQDVPIIDDPKIPQGLAGGSAYIMLPEGAKKVVERVETDLGLWHNDALLCYQNFDFLGVTKTYYTTIQRDMVSTTT